VLGRVRTAEAPHAPGLRLRYAAVMDGMREAIDKRIRAVVPGDKGAIACERLQSLPPCQCTGMTHCRAMS
jgi:hypothetical protein